MVSVAAHGAALLLLSASVAVAQLALPSLLPSLVNVTAGATNLPGAGPVYKREDTLAPFYANLYGIPVPAGVADPDIYISLEVLNDNKKVGLYCNPGWGMYGDATHNYPQPGNSVWSADASDGNDTIVISQNDKLYRPPYARSPNTTEYDSYTPYFICAVINTDSRVSASYRLEADLISNNATLSPAEQTALANIFAQCCQGDNCIEWKAQNQQNGGLVTDFCAVLGQICTPEGHLLRLDLRGANLQCDFPAQDFTAFQWLTTLNLGRNPNLQGNLSDIFASLSGAPNLQNINLFRDISLSGPLVPESTETGALCKLAKASLQHLNMESVGAEGTLPACLFDAGSQLIELQLGRNNLTGTIPDVFAPDSPLETLALASNQLEGPLPESLGTLQNLADFDVTQNNLVGTIPATLGNIPTLKHVILKFNNLTGAIPASLATAPLIETLDLKGNQLSSLPLEWLEGYPGSANSSFVNVRFSFNKIEGPFPAGLSDAPQLTFLVINNNSMSGPLPNKDAMFPALRALNASRNSFVGTIPDAFGTSGIFVQQAMQFQDGEILEHVFDLSYNQLTGELPPFLDESKVPSYARRIYLQGNALSIKCTAATDFLADVCSGSAAAAPTDMASLYPVTGTAASGPGLPAGTADPSSAYQPSSIYQPGITTTQPQYPSNTNSQDVYERSTPYDATQSASGSGGGGGGNKAKIIGGVVGGLLALLVIGALVAFLLLRRGGSKPASASFEGGTGRQGGLGTSLKGALASAKGNKFERFTEGMEMSDAHGNGNSRIQGFGSGV